MGDNKIINMGIESDSLKIPLVNFGKKQAIANASSPHVWDIENDYFPDSIDSPFTVSDFLMPKIYGDTLPHSKSRKESYIASLWVAKGGKELELDVQEIGIFNRSIKVEVKGNIICEIDSALNILEKNINESKYILELGDDFDGEGSIGYSVETWTRAILFISKQFNYFFKKFNIILPSPKIFHGPDGSIDMLWKQNEKIVLLNFPFNEIEKITFSASNANGDNVKGYLMADSNSDSLLFSIASFL